MKKVNAYERNYIILMTLISCIMLYFIEQGIGVSYAVKTAAKLCLFITVPLVYMKFIKKEPIHKALMLSELKLKNLKAGIIFALISFLTIFLCYMILKNQIDLGKISSELQSKLKVTPANFIFVGLYISLCNSFLEEFFFRGFIFLNLYNQKRPYLAYIYSSLLFSLYHIMIFKNWFTLPVFLLAVAGLAIVGLLFNWLDTRSNNFINSWIPHIAANIAIILIGMKMFKMI